MHPEVLDAPAIVGLGGVLPGEPINNDTIARGLSGDPNASGDWIERVTGIRLRHRVPERGVYASDLGTVAAMLALESAGILPEELDAMFVGTSTADIPGPSVASLMWGKMREGRYGLATDVKSACAGGVVAMASAAKELISNSYANITMGVGTETLSKITNPRDRKTAVLFGDGAGAAVLRRVKGAHKLAFADIIEPDLEAINAMAGGCAEPGTGLDDPRRYISMDGKKVVGHAVPMMVDVAKEAARRAALCDKNGNVLWDEIDLFVPHQANGPGIIRPVADELAVPEDKRVVTVDIHGNTSAASVPLALREAWQQGRLEGRKRVLFVGAGAGMVASGLVIDVILPKL